MSGEFRRRPRRQVESGIPVSDVMTGAVAGRIGNLSETGMLLLAQVPLREDALYQFRFTLPDAASGHALELGAHLLWLDFKDAPGTAWAGFRFIGVPEDQAQRLRAWIADKQG